AATNSINEITYTSLSGNRLQIVVSLASTAQKPVSFTIDNPARIALDFSDTTSNLKQKTQPIGAGVADSVTTVTAKGKTRMILNLAQIVPYKVETEKNKVIVTLNSDSGVQATAIATPTGSKGTRSVNRVDFRRGDKGEGRVVIQLSDANIPMDVSEQNGKVIVRFIGASLPASLHQRLDVTDFATPVKAIDSFILDNAARIEIDPVNSNFEHLAYQTDKIFTIELKPISKKELDDIKKQKFGYVGERLSLNFQDIPVRAVLQLIADFTSMNIVVSDSVDGNLTLRLKNVPWDQALDIILKAKGLDKRENGNVVLVAPSEEIAAQEKIELEAKQQATELAPLRTAHFQINFAKATELEKLFKGEAGKGGLLSERGQAIIDERTNTLMIKDTDENITEVRRILAQLDVPVRQVLIESRIVIATDDFAKELGVRLGKTSNTNDHGAGIVNVNTNNTSGTLNGTTQLINGDTIELEDRLNVNMPVLGAAGSIGFAILSGGSLLELELSARQAENQSEIIASPRVVTADRNEAFIESGVEIPYETASSSGATTISFKKAVLSIKVKPQITPDDRIIMDLTVNKDAVGEVYDRIPSIDTREIQTQVLVNNGDTVVLGGIYESNITNELDKVPVFGDLPLIGALFRHTLEKDEKAELLIFVTPKILKETLSL
ncbi:MAG: type pilus assembly protein PilQ, partial [Pseudomonadota bacterium]|nr:type pilus assembly protein PilQ [Pseudomonadota bacterium]